MELRVSTVALGHGKGQNTLRASHSMMSRLITPFLLALVLWSRGAAATSNRTLNVFDFGGLEKLSVERNIQLLRRLGYAGICVNGWDTERLKEYLQKSDRLPVRSVLISHNFALVGFTMDASERAAMNLMSRIRGGGTVWLIFQTAKSKVQLSDVLALTNEIVAYAKPRNIQVVLYPHGGTYFTTVNAVWPFLQKYYANDTMVGTSINLVHERLGRRGAFLNETFVMAHNKTKAVILSGQKRVIDFSNAIDSLINPLDESEYNLRPFLRYMRDSGYEGEVFFLNFKISDPLNTYLNNSLQEWTKLADGLSL